MRQRTVVKAINLPQIVFDCDGCGECCRSPFISVDHVDAMREPRIAIEGTLLDGHGRIPPEDATWALEKADGSGCKCVFLGTDNRCGIYASRPTVCVAFQPGSEQCQERRRAAGLPKLKARAAATELDRISALLRL